MLTVIWPTADDASQVFAHHGRAFGAGDLDQIVADFADDAVMISPAGVKRGGDGAREAFTQVFADLPDAAAMGHVASGWRVRAGGLADRQAVGMGAGSDDGALTVTWSTMATPGVGAHRRAREPRPTAAAAST
jgi:hypothetical protein